MVRSVTFFFFKWKLKIDFNYYYHYFIKKTKQNKLMSTQGLLTGLTYSQSAIVIYITTLKSIKKYFRKM